MSSLTRDDAALGRTIAGEMAADAEVARLRDLMGGDRLAEGIARLNAMLADGLKGRTHDVWERAHRAGVMSARAVLVELRAEARTAVEADAVGISACGNEPDKSPPETGTAGREG